MTQSSSATIRALVVDDEKPARELLVRLLAGHSDLAVVGECANGREAVSAVAKQHPDVMFFHIRMPGHDGFGVPERLGDSAPLVIFVTAFEYHAFNYLLRPFRRERLNEALTLVRQRLHSQRARRQTPRMRELLQYWNHVPRDDAHDERQPGFLQRVFVKSGRHSISIEIENIEWIRSVDHFVQIHSRGKIYMLYSSIGALETKLDPNRFLRIHRTTVINLNAVREFRLSALGRCSVILKDGAELAVSRNRRATLRDRLEASSHPGNPTRT